ncbi:MAG: hypothetical protein LBH74_03990 [Nitrososphaerota archaeon]|jgi:hypothetical protein|nr:hypothetical protein [Nitrososphaerota archaeon]
MNPQSQAVILGMGSIPKQANPAEGSTKSLLLSFAGFVTSIDLLPADDKSKLVCRLESRCNVVFFDYFL